MERDEKLDLILNKLQNIETAAEKNKLHYLAKEHWGLVDNDIRIIELAKTILDRGKNNEGKVMQLVCEMSGIFDRIGEDGVKSLFTIEQKPNTN